MNYGPQTAFAEQIHSMKHRQPGESFEEGCERVANALKDDDNHFTLFKRPLKRQQFLPGGRVQLAMGAPTATTPYNCFVSPTIPDSMDGIMDVAKYAAATMRMGGGIGYDFSNLRPRWDNISSLGAPSSGPVSFMQIFDSVCGTISSAGNRRGAMMAVLRVDHPDIEEFITAKHNTYNLTNFNLSIGVTDAFMLAVIHGLPFDLRFGGRTYKTIDARNLWEKIMRSTWDWAEPGVLFIDRINEMNNLWYCERIAATNPCAEQPLPPNGACLLGSFNLTKYMFPKAGRWCFDLPQFVETIPAVVRAMDNIVDRAIYPMPEQRQEALSKRRMGLGVTGVANAIEAMGFEYGSDQFLDQLERTLRTLRNEAYRASALLAAEKGPFPLFDRDSFLDGNFADNLPPDVRDLIAKHGIRNSHLTSIAPTGTISLTADNVSSGIEPVFSTHYKRTVQYAEGPKVEQVWDYGAKVMGVEPKTAGDCTADDHLKVLLACTDYVDSATSKTCNVSPNMPWEDFKDIYMKAWQGGAKGCTTFNPGGKRFGVLNADDPGVEDSTQTDRYGIDETEGAACYMDPSTGERSCG